MIQSICVYSSSSDPVDPRFFTAATALGVEIARRRHTLVYGRTKIGLMGALARAVQENAGRVVGMIPS